MNASKRKGAGVWVCAGLLCILASPALAQQRDVWIQSCAIRADITGRLATTTIEHVYINQGTRDAEATFRFRLPPGGSVHDLAMWIDGVRSPAVVYPRATARRIYRQIVERHRDPAILEYLGEGLWSLRIFPILTHGSQKIELVCTHVMPLRKGRILYESPQVVQAVSAADKLDFSARIRCPGGVKDLRAETHRMGVHAGPDGTVRAGFSAEKLSLAKPIVLSFVPGRPAERVITWRQPDGAGCFWAVLPSPAELFEGLLRPKTFVLVLDVSASMSGWRLADLKKAAGAVLSALTPDDRLALVTAGSDAAQWKDKLVAATPENVAAARAYLAGLRASGGTDLAAAFRAADGLNTDLDKPCYLLVLSDGGDLVGAKGLGRATDLKPPAKPPAPPAANVQMHWFLIGAYEEHYDAAVVPTRHGKLWHVDYAGEWREAVNQFRRHVAKPAVADLALSVTGDKPMGLRDAAHLAPRLRTELVLTGRYAKGGEALITLSAEIDGRKTRWPFKLPLPDPPAAPPAAGGWMGPNVSKVRAHLACGMLWSRLRSASPRVEDLERLVEISRRHRVVTRATAFLILENTEAYVLRGIEPPGVTLAQREDLSTALRVRAHRRPVGGEAAKQIAELKKVAAERRAAGEYAAAARALEQVKKLDPTEYAACLAGAILREFGPLHVAGEVARRGRARARQITRGPWHEMLVPVGVASLIPAPDLVRPAPKPSALPELPKDNPAVVAKLRQKIPKLEFDNIPLGDVLAFLRDLTQANIRATWRTLQVAGIDPTTGVNLRLADVTAEKALRTILEDLGGVGTRLGYEIDKGVVTISTREELSRHVSTVTFNVRDLIRRPAAARGMLLLRRRWRRGGGGGFFDDDAGDRIEAGAGVPLRVGSVRPAPAGAENSVRAGSDGTGWRSEETPAGARDVRDMALIPPDVSGRGGEEDEESWYEEPLTRAQVVQELIELIRSMVDPTCWQSAGGEVGSIREFNGLLIIKQTRYNHRAIRDLLKMLRAHGPDPAQLEPRVTAPEAPEAMFTPDARPTAWVLELLRRAGDKKLSKFSSVQVREAGKRTFARIGGIWFDTGLTKASCVRLVQRGSLANDALTELAPGLKPCLALGRSVVVALGARCAVSLDAIGITKPDDPKLKELLAAAKK